MNIEIEAFPDWSGPASDKHRYNRRRGRKAIIVDGLRWGRIEMQSCGSNGTLYTFSQDGLNDTVIEGELERNHKTVRVRSERARRWSDPSPVAPSLEKRLEMEVRALIEDKILLHPDAAHAKHQAKLKKYRDSLEFQKRQEAQAFEAKAREALAAANLRGKAYRFTLDKVVEVMKWAQTQ